MAVRVRLHLRLRHVNCLPTWIQKAITLHVVLFLQPFRQDRVWYPPKWEENIQALGVGLSWNLAQTIDSLPPAGHQHRHYIQNMASFRWFKRFFGHKVVSKDIWSFLIIRINLTWRFLFPWRKMSCQCLAFYMNNKNRNILEESLPGFQTHYPTSHPLSSTSGRNINKSSNNVMNNSRQADQSCTASSFNLNLPSLFHMLFFLLAGEHSLSSGGGGEFNEYERISLRVLFVFSSNRDKTRRNNGICIALRFPPCNSPLACRVTYLFLWVKEKSADS